MRHAGDTVAFRYGMTFAELETAATQYLETLGTVIYPGEVFYVDQEEGRRRAAAWLAAEAWRLLPNG